jgi:hypothetical protein
LGEPDQLQRIWELAEDNLTTEEIKNNLLLATDSKGNTTWRWATVFGGPEILQGNMGFG